MRILGFSKKDWYNYQDGHYKFLEDEFTTFRIPRLDKDWQVGELVQVVYKQRTSQREVLGIAQIVNKKQQLPWLGDVSVEEARRDGFRNYTDMWQWFYKTHGKRLSLPINKLTLRWINKKEEGK